MTEERMIELETKIAFQELAIEDLQKLVYEQHKAITTLETKLERLTNELLGQGATGEAAPGNDKPPHY